MNKFYRTQSVKHVKSGRQYCITQIPQEHLRLEYCNEPFYVYRSIDLEDDKGHVLWHRPVSEMEDGRFVANY